MTYLLPTNPTDRPNYKRFGNTSGLEDSFAAGFAGKGLFSGGYSGLKQGREEINQNWNRDGLLVAGEHPTSIKREVQPSQCT
ncbi:MAG: hypothetical protein ACM37W_17130 [Actinomycetota bacterium]